MFIVLAVAFSLNLSFLLTFISEVTDLLARKVIPGVGATGADREGRVCVDVENRLVAAQRDRRECGVSGSKLARGTGSQQGPFYIA